MFGITACSVGIMPPSASTADLFCRSDVFFYKNAPFIQEAGMRERELIAGGGRFMEMFFACFILVQRLDRIA